MKTVLITGGCGFIGSALIRMLLTDPDYKLINVDKLTYAGNLNSLKSISSNERYIFEKLDICNKDKLKEIFKKYRPNYVMHLAAESHVDRSIEDPDAFIQTNIVGTYNLLNISLNYFLSLNDNDKKLFKFHHISTDEVFGDLEDGDYFTEETSYSPSSPYSATKASSDHLVRAWHRTYGLPVVITNCSNNYGPCQHPEKLIPHIIISALEKKQLTIFGDGTQVRDWLYVDDHAKALIKVLTEAEVGETFNIGGNNEKQNIEVVSVICELLDVLSPLKSTNLKSYKDLILHVSDRPGHDTRYAINASKIQKKLDWKPEETFNSGIKKTIKWYLKNKDWWQPIINNSKKV